MFDENGRFAPTYDEEDTRELKVDTIVFAIGQGVEAEFAGEILEQRPNSTFACDKDTLQSTKNEKIFVAGDASGESVIAIQALATGRRAAQSVIRFLRGEDLRSGRELKDTWTYETKLQMPVDWDAITGQREDMQELDPKKRIHSFDEVALGYTKEEAEREAARCRQCECKKNSTVRILKTPKTESSVRKIFLPKSVANMLVDWKVEQDEMKEILGDEYMDYNLVMASTFGLPLGDGAIRGPLKKLIEDYNLPPVVFHSFRHSSVTYKLKLNGGDIKAVQGDSGHAQVNMVTDVYSHILDDDRRKNAELFEEAFYEKKNLDPQMHVQQENNNATVADEVDPELLAKVLANPEMRALLNSLAKTMK